MDSDDYFTEDIVLDDETLAVLDHEEQKYLTQISLAPSQPPTKRQRTDNGWNPGLGNRPEPLDGLDELPEISLRDDGSYGVRGASTSAGSEQSPGHVNMNGTSSAKNFVVASSALRCSTLPGQNVSGQVSFLSLPMLGNQYPSHSQNPSPQGPLTLTKQQVSHGQAQTPMFNPRASCMAPSSNYANITGQPIPLHAEIKELRLQLDKVDFHLHCY
jgi:hypothetical protein